MMNNLLEFGGVGQIIATALCDFDINNIHYKKDDVILFFNDVQINFFYRNLDSVSKSLKSQVSYNEYFLDSVSINEVPLNNNFNFLLSKETEKVVKEVEESLAMNNVLLLKHLPIIDSIRIKGISNYNVDVVNDVVVISSSEFVNSTYYTVEYDKTINCSTCVLDNSENTLPYLKLQIKFKGNVDKNTNEGYVFIPKAAAVLNPIFSLSNNVSSMKVFFRVLDDKIKPTLSVVQNGL